MILSFKYRVKDKNRIKQLREAAWKSNQVWNFCVALQRKYPATWFSHFDFVNATKKMGKELGVHSDTRGAVCKQFVHSRNKHKKIPKFRKSGGAKRSLGWCPFIQRAVNIEDDQIVFQKIKYRFWKHRDMPENFKTGCFVENACGKWFVVFTANVEDFEPREDKKDIGIDLGLKDLATLSDGVKIEAPRTYRLHEQKLKIAQRAKNKKRVKVLHQKIKNIRKHHHHIVSANIAKQYKNIFVGDVNSSKLAKTKMAKSVLDAGWYQLKSFLAYKVRRHQGQLFVVDERFTTQTCSHCGALPDGRPKGIAGLRIRNWECGECGTVHDRDVNSAILILRFGLERQPLVEENLSL
jgi:transposase